MKFKKPVYHVTTTKKARKYITTGAILPPVRYWICAHSANRFARKTGRNIMLCFEEPEVSYPLPIKGGAKWSPNMVRVKAFEDQLAIIP